MANYYGTGRSNYVKVKDRKAFDEWAEKFSDLEVTEQGDLVGFLGCGECGDLPQFIYPEEIGEDEVEIDFLKEMAEHLVEEDNNIFVWQSAGHEKMRYVNGFSEAVNHKGERAWVGLHQIYDLCKEKLGTKPATLAEY